MRSNVNQKGILFDRSSKIYLILTPKKEVYFCPVPKSLYETKC